MILIQSQLLLHIRNVECAKAMGKRISHTVAKNNAFLTLLKQATKVQHATLQVETILDIALWLSKHSLHPSTSPKSGGIETNVNSTGL